jgi:serine/threonine protein kinase/Leucine-rich repeat (LRR) protein
MNELDIFSAAIELKVPEDRDKYLAEACGDNEGLRQRIKSLLRSSEEAGSFIESAAHKLNLGATIDVPMTEKLGTQIGPYKLLQQIGEGGMGVVYMAEQQKPVRRRVALKIIKPGMDSRQVIARFEAERQALAMMDHPNIARVLDAGCTESGRPYFAMELVQGIPITQFCDDKQLNTLERLELFIQVCQAVQHAHQKGIIHRDLKPSNVLIGIYDSKPIPKIIDFGVAKALHQQLTEKTLFTQFGAVVGTLEYMSPEQADMDLIGMDTRSDIYSLGVLLYELLTGSTPLDGKKLRALGYAEMLKTIREVDPPKPSTRLSRSAHDLANVSAKRHTEPRRLQKLVAGDLDWIVMKCLEKDRTRRYETANGLALDIQRHLHDEAVLASPPGQFYKLQKLLRRNKLVFAAVGCVMLALVIGLAGSVWQAARATAALNDLRAAAPSIAAEARALAAQEKFDDAIGKLDYAAKLRPDVPDYVLAKADLLETQLRLADAAAAYRAAMKLKPGDARATDNAELCEQLAAAAKSPDGKLTRESLARLNTQMAKDQRPAAEVMPVARLLGDEKKYIVSYWLDRLKDVPNGTDKPLERRLTVRDDGLLDLNLADTQIADLSPLAGMPLGMLNISSCAKVTDLLSLRGMPLRKLSVDGTGVTSLEPLRGMSSFQSLAFGHTKVSDLTPLSGLRLTKVDMQNCPVTSLEPLRGMPLEELSIGNTGIINLSVLVGMPLKILAVPFDGATDFTPLIGLPLESLNLQGDRVGDLGFLKGLPLKQLVINNTLSARNLRVLSEIRSLEVLVLPELSDLPVEDFTAVENLRNHPSLKQLAVFSPIGIEIANVPSKDEFWKNWDRDHAWALRLKKAKFTFTRGQYPDRTWWLVCKEQALSDLSMLSGARISLLALAGDKISDLSPLKGLPLRELFLANNPVEDLTALGGIKLETLNINGTRVRDLAPVRGMPLKNLDARSKALTDLSPLANSPDLEALLLPIHAADLEPLRKLPNLKRLSFSNAGKDSDSPETPAVWPALTGIPSSACTVANFWKTWDGLPWARKLEAAGIDFDFDQSWDGYFHVQVHDPKLTDCSMFTGSNIRGLSLYRNSVVDLSGLAGLPLESLTVFDKQPKDLSVLRSPELSKSLRHLRVVNSENIADFYAPVAACTNLESFDAHGSALADLSILTGMKLHRLLLGATAVSDITALAGMPLETVDLSGTKLTDVAPLLKCPTLRKIVLPPDAQEVTALRALPNLERISYDAATNGDPDKTAEQFWAINREEPWLAALRKTKLTYKTRQLKDHTWELTLDRQPIADLSILQDAKTISRLYIAYTQVVDLTPVHDMNVAYLRISNTNVTDLSPLKGTSITNLTMGAVNVRDLAPLVGLPLRVLNMPDCPLITDLSPLAEIRTLETVILPPNAKNIEVLRKLPKLKQLGYKFASNSPLQTAEEFWAEFDRTKGAAAP